MERTKALHKQLEATWLQGLRSHQELPFSAQWSAGEEGRALRVGGKELPERPVSAKERLPSDGKPSGTPLLRV